jgi:hypothetical protein
LVEHHVQPQSSNTHSLSLSLWLVLCDTAHKFLDGLYLMLSEKDKDIRREADNLLSEFLREIQSSALDLQFGSMISILLPHCSSEGIQPTNHQPTTNQPTASNDCALIE